MKSIAFLSLFLAVFSFVVRAQELPSAGCGRFLNLLSGQLTELATKYHAYNTNQAFTDIMFFKIMADRYGGNCGIMSNAPTVIPAKYDCMTSLDEIIV